MALLEKSRRTSHCPYKGIASYYSIPTGGPRSNDAAWSYEEPYAAVAKIKDYMAFYPDRVASIEELEETDVGVAVPFQQSERAIDLLLRGRGLVFACAFRAMAHRMTSF